MNCLKKRPLRAKIYVRSLVSYPPEICTKYSIKKPGDVPKMNPGDYSTYRYCAYGSGGATLLEQLLLYGSTSILKAPCAERRTSAPRPDLLTGDGTVDRSNSTHAPTTEVSPVLYAFRGNFILCVLWSTSRITR